MYTRIVQKAVILDKDNRMLMLRRSNTDVRRPLQWDLPGGLYEEGEELIASVNREIDEETGLEVTDLRPIYSQTEVRNWKLDKEKKTENIVFIYYCARTGSNDVKLSLEHDKFQWKTIEEAEKEYEYKTQKEILRYIIDNQLLI
jgi:8-oxo-dGTP diphosphatase